MYIYICMYSPTNCTGMKLLTIHCNILCILHICVHVTVCVVVTSAGQTFDDFHEMWPTVPSPWEKVSKSTVPNFSQRSWIKSLIVWLHNLNRVRCKTCWCVTSNFETRFAVTAAFFLFFPAFFLPLSRTLSWGPRKTCLLLPWLPDSTRIAPVDWSRILTYSCTCQETEIQNPNIRMMKVINIYHQMNQISSNIIKYLPDDRNESEWSKKSNIYQNLSSVRSIMMKQMKLALRHQRFSASTALWRRL